MDEHYGSVLNKLSALLTDSDNMRMYTIPQIAAMMHNFNKMIISFLKSFFKLKTYINFGYI